MDKWQEIDEDTWQNEAPLISINVMRARGKAWKIVLAGRNLMEVLPGCETLVATKGTATRAAKRFLKDIAKTL